MTVWRHVSICQASPSPSQGVRWGLPRSCPCQAVLAGRQACGRARPCRVWLPPTLGALKGPLVRRPCLPAAAHSPVLLPHKRLICYIFSDAVNGRTKTFSLSYFCSIMFVGEPDPLQRGAEELRGSLPGLLTSQAFFWAQAPRASLWLFGPGCGREGGQRGDPFMSCEGTGPPSPEEQMSVSEIG